MDQSKVPPCIVQSEKIAHRLLKERIPGELKYGVNFGWVEDSCTSYGVSLTSSTIPSLPTFSFTCLLNHNVLILSVYSEYKVPLVGGFIHEHEKEYSFYEINLDKDLEVDNQELSGVLQAMENAIDMLLFRDKKKEDTEGSGGAPNKIELCAL